MAVESLGVGLVGCGVMGECLARQLVALPQARLVAVADPVCERAEALGAELSTEVLCDAEALWERTDIDVVLIAVPGYLHRPLVEAAASASMHIFCEKPLALTVSDCDAMIARTASAGVALGVGQVLRYYPAFAKAKEIADAGTLGKPFSAVLIRVGGGWGEPSGARWRLERAKSGGLLLEVSAHELDFLRVMLGEPTSVSAAGGQYVHRNQDYEDMVHVQIRFAGGGAGTLIAGQTGSLGGYQVRVYYTGGTLFFDGWKTLCYQPFDGEEVVLGPEALPDEDPVRWELRLFLDALLEGRPPPVTGEDGRMAVAMAEAAYASLESGLPAPVGSHS